MSEERLDVHSPQVAPEHYRTATYESKKRFISYWHQIDEVRQLAPASVLEVGIGSGFVSRYLKEHGLNVTTLDFDERLAPDVVGSVLDLPFEGNAFEVAACFEVLEHLPYENFVPALAELYRVASGHVLLSLPDARPVYRLELEVPGGAHLRRLVPYPQLRRPSHDFDGQHYWEIGKRGFSLRRIIEDIRHAGFDVEKRYRMFEYPYHHFFVLNGE